MGFLHLRAPQRRAAALSALLFALLACEPRSEGGIAPPAPAEPPGGKSGPYVSAHGGGTGYAPDDSLTAFRNAVRLGADELEMDSFVTADGEVVIIHDETVDRVSDCSGDVGELTLAEMQTCDAAYEWEPGQGDTRAREGRPRPLRGKGITFPSAREVFAEVAALGERAPQINIEIKIDTDELPPLGLDGARALVPLIQASGIKHRIVVQSFLPTAIDAVKLLDPEIRTSFLIGQTGATLCTIGLVYAIARGHDIISPEYVIADLDQACVDAAHAAGIEVLPWTVDREDDLRRLIDLGVDGIITNYPACLLRLLERPYPANFLTPEIATPPDARLCAD